MGILIIDSDFKGKWALAKSNEDLIDEYIEEYEERFLTELLGKELFDLFKADLTGADPGTPTDVIYKKIFNPFTEKINSRVYASNGMKEVLTGLIYCYYVRDNKVKQTMNGAVDQQTEVSTPSENTFLYLRYNKAVKSYEAIQQYILNNMSTYPTFYGLQKKLTSFV